MPPQILGPPLSEVIYSWGLGRSRQSVLIPPGPIPRSSIQFISVLRPSQILVKPSVLSLILNEVLSSAFGLLGYTFSLQNKSWSHSWVRNKTDLCPEAVSDPSEIPDAIGIALDVLILREVLSSSGSTGRGNASNISPSGSLLKLNSSLMPPQVFMTYLMLF